MPRPKLLLFCTLVFCLMNLYGCNINSKTVKKHQSEPSTLTTQPLITNQPINTTQSLYRQAPSLHSSEETWLHLKTIDSLIANGDSTTAKESADSINPAHLSPPQQSKLHLLYAQILLNFGEAEQALEKLALIQPTQFNREDNIKHFQSLAFAFSLTGNLLESAKSRIELHHLLPETDRAKNQSAILETLALLPETELQYTQTNELAGWISLASLSKYIGDPDFTNKLSIWHTTFPNHPADLSLLSQLHKAPLIFDQPKSIAILLPESGTFAQAGNAVRAGFMAAYNDAKSTTNLRFYDTSQMSPLSTYTQALADGATIVLGPLDKESIQNLADSTDFSIPVLALNHIDGLQKENLYQFGLSPIDDTQQISNNAKLDGHINILSLVPENASGQRMNNYFRESWENLGGHLVETQTYDLKNTDFFSLAIKKILNIDESEQRYEQIIKTIATVKYTPRHREDSDAIFIGARSTEARSINPLLGFFQAGDLSVYAISSVYTGEPDPSLDADLNNIQFCDIPWLFNKSYSNNLSMALLKESWKNIPREYLRLFAMGIDTFHLTSRLNNLEYASYSGASGELSLTLDNRIRRRLTCAKFINGQPKITDRNRSIIESTP